VLLLLLLLEFEAQLGRLGRRSWRRRRKRENLRRPGAAEAAVTEAPSPEMQEGGLDGRGGKEGRRRWPRGKGKGERERRWKKVA